MAVDALELRPRTTLALFDAAIRLCSRSMGVWGITLPAGAALVAATIELVDAVVHHRSLLGPAAGFTAAWMFRAVAQGAAAHYLEQQILEQTEASAARAFWAALKRAPALMFTAGYCLTLNTLIWCFSLGIGFFLVTAHLTAYAVAMKGRGGLLGLYGTCARMLGPARHTASTLRLCNLTQLIVAFNIDRAVNGGLIVLGKLLAFNVTFANRFASLDNPIWVATLAALTFTLFEPLRAASAALLLIDGRVRQEGLDLVKELEQLPRRRKAKGAATVAVALLAVVLWPGLARAQDDWSGTWSPSLPRSGQSTALSQRLQAVLTECGREGQFPAARLRKVDELPGNALAPTSRFVSRVERLAYDEENCDGAIDELERGLKEIEAIDPGASTAADSRSEARAVLARPEFAVDPPVVKKPDAAPEDQPEGPIARWWRELWERLVKWLFEPDREHRERHASSVDFGPALGLTNVVMVLAVLLVLGVLAYLLVRSVGPRRPGEIEAEQSGVRETALEPDPMNALSRPPEGWAGLADELAQKGLFREAIRNLYLALLSRLHRDGAIDYDPSKSNWDYFRAFKGPMSALTPFKELTRRFDFAWYGNLEVSAHSWSTFRTLTQPLLDTSTPSGVGNA